MSYYSFFNKYFPVPHFLEMSHAGVDISSGAIRVVELIRTSKGLRLRKCIEEKLENPILPSESILQRSDVLSILKKIKKENNFKFVEVSIPEEKSYLFTIEVVDGTKEEIRTRIEMHIEENVPVSLDEAVFDYHRITKNEKTGMQFLAVSVVPKTVIDEYITLFESCGFLPISFLIENQALSRAIVKKGDKNSYLVVNINYKNTVISIVNDEAVQFTSTIPMGSEDFTNSLMGALSTDKDSALFAKFDKGFSREVGNEKIASALMSTASVLIEEIRKVSVYWNSVNNFKEGEGMADSMFSDQNKNIDFGVEKIILAGQDASMPGFKDYLSISLKTPVSIANVWTNIFSFENEIPEISMKDSLSYGTAFGLALLKDQ